jgi:hypothetical protein
MPVVAAKFDGILRMPQSRYQVGRLVERRPLEVLCRRRGADRDA